MPLDFTFSKVLDFIYHLKHVKLFTVDVNLKHFTLVS